MKRQHSLISTPDSSVVEEALASVGSDELRELVLDLLPWLDDKIQARVTNEIIDRAARNRSGWKPSGPTNEDVTKILAFAKAATGEGYADPSEVDNYLRLGINAFLCKDYRSAFQIFRALLIPISEGEIDLGQHEMVDEVLGVDVSDCAIQYVVAMYMTADIKLRDKAVWTAIEDMRGIDHFWEPLRDMERAVVEPLPDFDEFLLRWRSLVREATREDRRHEWDTDQDRWLREVVLRLEGVDGLASIARSKRRSDDFQAWCNALVKERDWKAALSAFEEAAEAVIDKTYSKGRFLDGAALAVQELGSKDLPKRLERAWRTDPSLLRLLRWLGLSENKTTLKKSVTKAIEDCPREACRQLALLHVLRGEFDSAAKLLASAPGLGWSHSEHPGHLLFPIVCRLLDNDSHYFEMNSQSQGRRDMEIDELVSFGQNPDEPRLVNPSVEAIIAMVGIGIVDHEKERTVLINAMRTAAEKRIEGVTDKKRRRYYGHAASLASCCVAVDGSNESVKWIAEIRDEYRRFPALQREFKRCGL